MQNQNSFPNGGQQILVKKTWYEGQWTCCSVFIYFFINHLRYLENRVTLYFLNIILTFSFKSMGI